jgi:hypothetical protein
MRQAMKLKCATFVTLSGLTVLSALFYLSSESDALEQPSLWWKWCIPRRELEPHAEAPTNYYLPNEVLYPL